MGKHTHHEKIERESTEPPVLGVDPMEQDFQSVMWRVERLERQIGKLSELIREHAVDADRLVQIVAEDREILRQELALRLSAAGKPKKGKSALTDPIEVLPSQ